MTPAVPDIVVLVEEDASQVQELFEQMGWAADADGCWSRPDADVRIATRRRDDRFVALEIGGPDAELTRDDLAEVFELWDDVDLMEAMADVTSPGEVLGWVPGLGAFARGPLQPATQGVIEGLLASERPEFVAAMAGALHDARWEGLRGPLQAAARRLPSLDAACAEALASIDGATRQNPAP